MRHRALRVVLVAAALCAGAGLVEHYFEQRDLDELTRSETFATVNGARVRYRTMGSAVGVPMVVFINGMSGSLEQWKNVQPLVAKFAPAMTYDRAGTGFSRGSSAHDAAEQADELAGLLSANHFDGSVVLVGFSASASIARVFVGKYPSRVAGTVYIEPYLPELEGRGPSSHGPFRTYLRLLSNTSVTTFLGVRRLISFAKHARSHGPPSTLSDQRNESIILSFSHWWAVDREWFATWRTQREVLEAQVPRKLPMVVLSGEPWGSGDAGRALQSLYKAFLARSENGSLVSLGHTDHSRLLDEGESSNALIDAIRRTALPP